MPTRAARLLLCIASLLSVSPSTHAQLDDAPGNLFIAEALPLIGGPYFQLCGYIAPFTIGEISIWGLAPEDEVVGVSFSVEFTANVIVLGRSIALASALDTSTPDDDSWNLQFAECRPASRYIELIRYSLLYSPWLPMACLSSPSQEEPLWTFCAGGEVLGGRFPTGFQPFEDGCFTLDGSAPYCVVATRELSWGAIKAGF